MAAEYNRSGIRFLYPENWKITEDHSDAQARSVTVQAPCGAFWSVDLHLHTRQSRSLAAEVLQTMRQEYTDLEAEPISEQIGGVQAAGYDMQFYCMDLIIQSRVLTMPTDAGMLVMLCQGEDRDFQQLEPVFRAISESMFRSGDIL